MPTQVEEAKSPAAGVIAGELLVSEGQFTAELARFRHGAPWWRHVLLLAALVGLGWGLLQMIVDMNLWAINRVEALVALGGIACWRWSWFVIQNVRAMIYRYFVWPRLRRAAQRALDDGRPVPEVTVLATTYYEKPWITASVFGSIFRELGTLEGLERRSRVIVVTGCDQDDATVEAIFSECSSEIAGAQPELWPPELVLLRGANGKRPALAAGLEEIVRGNPREDGVVIILDGDTMLTQGLLRNVLPLFLLSPPVDAVTTNESNVVDGPAWFAEWTSLRFGLRHRSMCSVSLSGKLLCLTGRFSVFRASVAIDPTFREQVHHDVIDHWLWGSFEMLSGDDKSTWYWLAAHGKRMLYVPDAMVKTFEVIPGLGVKRALANIRRWSGNTVRHSWRAIRLGPGKLGFFAWWSLLDQRVTVATVLFGPTFAIMALCAGRDDLFAGYMFWVLCSRIAPVSIAWKQGRRFSVYYVPLQIIFDWTTAVTKLWIIFHPAQQNWLNRGARTLNSTKGAAFYGLRNGLALYLYWFSCATLIVVIGLFVGFIPLGREARLFLTPSVKESAAKPNTSVPGKDEAPLARWSLRTSRPELAAVEGEWGPRAAIRPSMKLLGEAKRAENNVTKAQGLLPR